MLRIAIIRPGSTKFDEEGRIKGSLDIPLSPSGTEQTERIADELHGYRFDALYCAPCESAIQTANCLLKNDRLKPKIVEDLENLNFGLWQGKLIDEVRLQQPKIYKRFQESPDSVCPPGGETLQQAQERISRLAKKWLKKHNDELIGVVVPDPLASIMVRWMSNKSIGDLWTAERSPGRWEMVHVTEFERELAVNR